MEDMSNEKKVTRYPKGRRPQFFEDSAVDEAMSMIMVLASEVSVLRDRLDTWERVAEKHEVLARAALEEFVPDEEALTAREAERQDFLQRLFFAATKRAHETATQDTDSRYHQVLDDIAKG